MLIIIFLTVFLRKKDVVKMLGKKEQIKGKWINQLHAAQCKQSQRLVGDLLW